MFRFHWNHHQALLQKYVCVCVCVCVYIYIYTGCPTTYQTRQFFNNFTTNEDIATKFEADLPHCVRNVTTS